MKAKGYPEELDYSPITWVKSDKELPAFFIVNIKHSFIRITVSVSWSQYEGYSINGGSNIYNTNEYPESIKSFYDNTINKFKASIPSRNVYGSKTFRAEAKYQGIIPDETRQKIHDALRSRLFNDLYIIAEARNWQFGTTIISRSVPIIVGWVEKTKQMFIIDCFDPTPLEDYLAPDRTL